MKRLLAVAVAVFTVSAFSSAQLAFRGIGGGIGFTSVSGNSGASTESMSGFLIAAHADLGEFTKDITFVPDIEYFSTSKDVSAFGASATWKISDFAINANAHYNIAMEGMLKPYVGAGLGYNSFSFSYATAPYNYGFGIVSGGTQSYSYSRIGINLLAGVNYQLNDMLTLVVEPRYVLASDFNNFQIKAGITYAMK